MVQPLRTGRRITIADIAREAGVSKGAVSFALNGRPGVSETTREKVLRIAGQLGWTPNSAAKVLSGGPVGAIGLVIDRPPAALGTEAFFNELLAGLQVGLGEAHSSLMVRMVSGEDEELQTYSSWWSSRRVDGVVVIDPHADDRRLTLLVELGLPTVIVGSQTEMPGVSAVWMDNDGVAATLFGYIAALGHRRIAYICGDESFDHVRARVRGLKECAEGRSLASEVMVDDFSAATAAVRTRHLLSRAHPPTSIVYDNDVMAVAGLNVAHEMGIDVPQQLSIASFDDSHTARLVRPAITAVSRDTTALGAQAARLLLAAAAGEESREEAGPAAELRVRASTAPPPR